MLRFDLRLAPRAIILAFTLAPFACGGESSSDGAGGAGGATSGGAGGSISGGGGSTSGGSGAAGGSGGTGGSVSGGGGSSTGGGGTGGCGPFPQGKDCIACGSMYPPTCQNGFWTCLPKTCPDASTDANPTCPANQVPTIDGCLACADASSKLYAAIEAARKQNATCGAAGDCVLTGSSTTCAGACQVAVSKTGEAAFTAALSKLDGAYCSGFVPVCGYSTPKCAVPTLECTGGLCTAKFN